MLVLVLWSCGVTRPTHTALNQFYSAVAPPESGLEREGFQGTGRKSI